MADTTPRHGFPYLEGTDLASDIDQGFQDLAEDLDDKVVTFTQGTAASIPAAGTTGRLYYATDTEVLHYDNGSAWKDIQDLLPDGEITATDLASSLLDKIGVSSSTIRRGKSVISTEETTTSSSYTTLTTPDQVSSLVLPTDGLIFLVYQAQWQCSASAAGRAAIFLGSDQQKVQNLSTFNGVAASKTEAMSTGTSRYQALISTPQSLISVMNNASAIGANVTTGQAQGVAYFDTPTATTSIGLETGSGGGISFSSGTSFPAMAGGIMTIFAAAGTYDVAVKFKTSSGTLSVKNRSLWVWTTGF